MDTITNIEYLSPKRRIEKITHLVYSEFSNQHFLFDNLSKYTTKMIEAIQKSYNNIRSINKSQQYDIIFICILLSWLFKIV